MKTPTPFQGTQFNPKQVPSLHLPVAVGAWDARQVHPWVAGIPVIKSRAFSGPKLLLSLSTSSYGHQFAPRLLGSKSGCREAHLRPLDARRPFEGAPLRWPPRSRAMEHAQSRLSAPLPPSALRETSAAPALAHRTERCFASSEQTSEARAPAIVT